ncbi:hypothetical protein FZ103_16480 [Streptomonospora sp. PA3]|uniref:hypothetical protein n=1 Tax=Streptomonospora sp. PA3 TaxID=2607326 RepID=UPI0013074EC7|nr:hypothetical protein [Streptomonospora sp. PA3]MUL42747.1 hypothetical protein [Streptomonospora sp. PA3]
MGVPLPYLLLSVALLLPRVFLAPGRTRAARVRAYAPQPVPARAPAPADHAAFCEVAEAHAHAWPEIRRLPGPLYVAADRPSGVQIASTDLGAFAAALDAYPRRRSGAVRPYVFAAHPPAEAPR